MSLPQTWAEFATALLPGLRDIYSATGVPAWLALAMAAHESGVPVSADSAYAVERNPWGVRCFQSQFECSGTGFQMYPDVTTAATSFAEALPASALVQASDPAAFMGALQAEGWDGPAPASDGYAASVLGTWGPPAQAALSGLGVDLITGQPASSGTTPSAPASSGGGAVARVAAPAAVVLLGVLAVAAAEWGLFEWVERREARAGKGALIGG